MSRVFSVVISDSIVNLNGHIRLPKCILSEPLSESSTHQIYLYNNHIVRVKMRHTSFESVSADDIL